MLGGEIMHILWLRKIYSYMGASYFSNKNNKIEIFEYLLFLVQYEVLQNKNKSFLREKIYIDGNNVRIKYISDLIRVRPFGFVRALGEDIDSLNEYVIIMKKYMAMGNSQIEKEVIHILSEKKLDERYFVFRKYKSSFMRCNARVFAHDVGYKSFIRTYILNLLTIAMLFALLYSYLYISSVDKNVLQENIHIFMFFVIAEVILIIISIIWTYLWSKPTKYEIENGYLEE